MLAVAGELSAQSDNHPCARCHPGEVERFAHSSMGRSLALSSDVPSGSFTHKASGSKITVYRDEAGQMRHKVEERGLTADYPIAYAVGSGIVGRSFIININGRLFQSPASYYNSKQGWDVSPGYQNAHSLDFDRPIRSDCLVCHAGSIEPVAGAVKLTPLSCDQCHGSPEKHLANPVPGSIVNPAKLANRERDSVCEQCHIEGATTVLNPGKTWSDLKPGMPLEAVETHYILKNPDGTLASLAGVSHAEQLAVSACARNSNGKLWCGTCHDPHGEKADRQAQIRQVCDTCHTPTQLAAKHTPDQVDCVGCHMPRRAATDVIHAAITDHRILKRPMPAMSQGKGLVLGPWQPPPPELARRNLGLAYFRIARQDNSVSEFQRAYALLSTDLSNTDPEVVGVLGYLNLGAGRNDAAIQLFRTATRLSPERAEYWLDLAVAQQAVGKQDEAILALNRSIDLDPYDYRPYEALAQLYGASQPQLARQTLDRFLTLVPQSLTIRLLQHP